MAAERLRVQGENDCVDTDPITFARPVAVAGIMMPTDVARFSVGRQYITDELDALRLFAGANSMAVGETLLTIQNGSEDSEPGLLERLGPAKRSCRPHHAMSWWQRRKGTVLRFCCVRSALSHARNARCRFSLI
jgi:hypothetical protein